MRERDNTLHIGELMTKEGVRATFVIHGANKYEPELHARKHLSSYIKQVVIYKSFYGRDAMRMISAYKKLMRNDGSLMIDNKQFLNDCFSWTPRFELWAATYPCLIDKIGSISIAERV